MKIIKNELISPFDCDDTLAMRKSFDNKQISTYVEDTVNLNKYVLVYRNEPMIRLLKEESARGAFVIVWSRGGYQWAYNVIKAFNLEDYVDLILTKPINYFDDTPVEKWMTSRTYLTPETEYKKQP